MKKELSYSEQDVAKRVRILRCVAVGNQRGSQKLFAERLGFNVVTWNNFERGSPLPRDAALALVSHFALTGLGTDWIYFGLTRGIDDEMLGRIKRATREIEASESKPLRKFYSGSEPVNNS